MFEFSTWLGQTDLSLTLQTTTWVIPTVQIIHIFCVCFVLGTILMVSLRVWGALLSTTPLQDVVHRFAPWLWASLVVLLATGTVLIIAEPIRELYSLSFWIKMGMIIVAGLVTAFFQVYLRRNAAKFDAGQFSRGAARSVAVVTLAVWLGVAVMGRWIAFDTAIFGDLSPHNNMPSQTADASVS